ncbi:MAG TPA: magnesium transporter [Deltaproteobacteria bacterium]|nr:magnesium transporter [Deltaproteobacteria bacterium]
MPVNPSSVKLLKEYIEKGWEFHIIDMLYDLEPVEIADLIESLDEESRGKFFLLLDVETASDVISELSQDSREDVLDDISDTELTRIVEDMNSDDAADLLGDLHAERAERILAALGPRESSEIKALLSYPEDSAGGIMQRELVSVHPNTTVDDVVAQIRQVHTEIDNIHQAYVVDSKGVLVGTVPLVKLVLSKPETAVSQIMDIDPLTVPVTMDQEEVARLFSKYDKVVMPVVDEEGMLLGRITIDDIVDIMEEEATEDMFRFAGAQEDLLSSSIVRNATTRIPWLFVCWLGGVLASVLIRGFEEDLSKIVGLAAFMPIILGMGGNVGTQSIALVVRGIATGVTSERNFFAVLLRQMGVGLVLGFMFGFMLWAIAFIMFPDDLRISLVIGFSIMFSMALAAFLGTFLPIMFYKLNQDPAVASGPFVTTAMDVLAVGSYLMISAIFLF